MLHFLFMEEGEEKEIKRRKKIKERDIVVEEKSFPGAGHTLLSVLWVAAVRCD
jgi:hypothetical protein